MELIQHPEIKSTYDKCKYKVKVWEHQFKKKNGRQPSKLDIREADREIRIAYKTYFNLKSAALEASFQDIDGFYSDEETPNSSVNTPKISSVNTSNELNIASNSTPNASGSFSSVDTSCQLNNMTLNDSLNNDSCSNIENKNTENTWGSHLSYINPDMKKAEAEEISIVKSNFSQKLFKNSSFSKRNPRKSLSFHARKSESNINPPKFLSQPTQSTFENEAPVSFEAMSSSILNTHTKFTAVLEPVQTQSLNIIQSVLENNFKTRRTLDVGWMQRVAETAGTKLVNKNIADNNFAFSQRINSQEIDEYDSDDIIADSDEEDNKFHVAKKRKVEAYEKDSQNSQRVNYGAQINNQKLDFSNIFNKADDQEGNDKQNDASPQIDSGENVKVLPPISEYDLEDEKSIKPKRKKRVTKPKKNIKVIEEITNESTETRKSTRQHKPIYIIEPDLEPADPYADEDSNDPEFEISKDDEKNQKYNFDDEEIEDVPKEPKKRGRPPKLEKVVKTKKSPKTGTKSKSNKSKPESNDDTEDVNATYELEYSIKPRIVTVPRDINFKNVIKKAEIQKRKTKPKKEELKDDATGVIIKDKKTQELETFAKKIASGNVNENFVRINLKKKIYARGKKTFTFSKFKKKQWKQNKAKALAGPEMDMGGCDGGQLICFKCGQVGHFAQKCTAVKGDALLPLTAGDEEYCPYPTLEEATEMAQDSVLAIRKPMKSINNKKSPSGDEEVVVNSDGEEIIIADTNSDTDGEENGDKPAEDDPFGDDDDEFLAETIKLEEYVKKIDIQEYMDKERGIKPYYSLKEDGTVMDTPQEVFDTLQMFGHASFRPGQEKAVMRILSGQSTLVTLSTGSGKSLCYQLAAYLYAKREPCIALIISPLVSLMEDQVEGIPHFLNAACLHTNKTKMQREKILEAISTGELDILLVSPEAVVAGEKSTGFGSLLRRLPPIAFACIDEAHCVSQWSHNFRPSYLMICQILKERLGVRTILGLTATATRATCDSIVDHLSIPDGHAGIISDIPLPNNLRLTVSKDGNRDHALLGLLLSDRFKDLKSVIVYCLRRQECERIAAFLRTSLQNEKLPMDDDKTSTKKRKRKVHVQAEPYHAGLAASKRRTVQRNFMSGELRIVVATVAFGMGINKSDIRAVIHFNLPKNFESYVQEVGRAGRDGIPAHCHLFLDAKQRDENELQRHIFSNSIDRHVIRKLLQKIFIPCSCKPNMCPKHEVAFSVQETVLALDLAEENISTLLCYLELHDQRYIEVLSPGYTVCKIIAYGTGNQIRKAAKDCPPLAMALAMFGDKETDENTFEFPVVEVAATIGWDSGICKYKLKNLEWTSENNQPKRSFLSVQFNNLGFRLLAPGNLTDLQLDEALDTLHQRVANQEQTALLQLHALHETACSVADTTYRTCNSDKISEKELKLKASIREYFDSPKPLCMMEMKAKRVDEGLIANDVRAIVSMYRDNVFTGRAVARIFYGIQSPNYPAVIWGRCKFWRTHMHEDFNAICRIATREILKMR